MTNTKKFWNWLWKAKNGDVVIAQWPNKYIWGWLGFSLASIVVTRPLAELFTTIGFVFLIIWSYLEITAGANGFRRLLGTTVLAWAIFNNIAV